MAAFAEPEIKAVIATIGGEDELKVLAHLDPEVLAANPKPFFGYSDSTNLHLFLWKLGLVS
jgi:muramoyltetrapeptide carboxypeptidase LdcA involved in peptidoglycan recycling